MRVDDFHKNLNFQNKFSFYFYYILFVSCYYYSIDLKRQSENSELRPDTSSLLDIYLNSISPIEIVATVSDRTLSTGHKSGQTV